MRDDGDSKVNKLIQTRIAPSVQVSDADARAFYDQNQQRMKTPPRVHVRHILIGLAPQASAADREAAHKKAQDLLQQLQNGGDFAQLAAQNSNDTGSVVTGRRPLLGPARADGADLREGGVRAPAAERAEPRRPDPLRLPHHPTRGARESQVVPFEQARGQLEAMLRDEKVKQALRAHVQELMAKGKVETFI